MPGLTARSSTPTASRILSTLGGRRRPLPGLRSTGPSAGRRPIPHRSSAYSKKYHFVGSFKAHDVDGVGGDSDEDEPHGIEVEGAPVVFDEHVGVPGEEDYEVNLLGFVADADDVFVGEDLEQQHEEGDEVQKITNQLE